MWIFFPILAGKQQITLTKTDAGKHPETEVLIQPEIGHHADVDARIEANHIGITHATGALQIRGLGNHPIVHGIEPDEKSKIKRLVVKIRQIGHLTVRRLCCQDLQDSCKKKKGKNVLHEMHPDLMLLIRLLRLHHKRRQCQFIAGDDGQHRWWQFLKTVGDSFLLQNQPEPRPLQRPCLQESEALMQADNRRLPYPSKLSLPTRAKYEQNNRHTTA